LRYPDQFGEGSVESLILSWQISGNEPILDIINKRGVVSILSPLDRSKTGWYISSLGTHELGGGNLTQTYVWMEKFDPCDPLSYLKFLLSRWQDIEEWDNYYPPNTEPIPDFGEIF